MPETEIVIILLGLTVVSSLTLASAQKCKSFYFVGRWYRIFEVSYAASPKTFAAWTAILKIGSVSSVVCSLALLVPEFFDKFSEIYHWLRVPLIPFLLVAHTTGLMGALGVLGKKLGHASCDTDRSDTSQEKPDE